MAPHLFLLARHRICITIPFMKVRFATVFLLGSLLLGCGGSTTQVPDSLAQFTDFSVNLTQSASFSENGQKSFLASTSDSYYEAWRHISAGTPAVYPTSVCGLVIHEQRVIFSRGVSGPNTSIFEPVRVGATAILAIKNTVSYQITFDKFGAEGVDLWVNGAQRPLVLNGIVGGGRIPNVVNGSFSPGDRVEIKMPLGYSGVQMTTTSGSSGSHGFTVSFTAATL